MFAAIDAGCAAVRVNPGNIKQFDDKVAEIARAATDAGTPIRIGVNAGSLDKRLLAKYGKATPEALVESALWECSLFEEHGFRDIKISVKHHDPVVMIQAYRLLAAKCDYPLHLGVTEAGPAFQGTIKSATAFGALLSQGIGDTIRVSLSAPPVEEVKVGIGILESMGMRQRGLEIVSCPSCGRAQVDVYKLAEEVTAGLTGLEVPLRVAVMGCVVNGPGEAREADLGVASGNGKGQIFVKGKVVATVPESRIVETLIDEAMRLAEQAGEQDTEPGQPSHCRLANDPPEWGGCSAPHRPLRSLDDDLADPAAERGVRVGGQQAVGDEHVDVLEHCEGRQADHAPLGVVGQDDDPARHLDERAVGLRFGEVRRGEPDLGVDAGTAEEHGVEVQRPDRQVGHRADERVRGRAHAAGEHHRGAVSGPRLPLNRLATRSELVTMVSPGTSSRHWASANVVVPAEIATAVPGLTRPAAARAMDDFSGRSSTSLSSKPGSWTLCEPGRTAPPCTFSTRPSLARTSRSRLIVMSETPSCCVRSLTRALPSLLTACRISDWRCLASIHYPLNSVRTV